MSDHLVRCHGLRSIEIRNASKGALEYGHTAGLERLCTLTESFASAVVGHVVATISAPGMPDFPVFEKQRLQRLLSG